MRNSGLLLLLAGAFIFLNANNFADVIRGRSTLGFLNPKSSAPNNPNTTPVQTSPVTTTSGGTGQNPVNDTGSGV